jgi:TolB-like protein
VLQAGDVVQVAAELTDPRTGDNLWARTFSRPAPDVITLQHEVALEIARGIRAPPHAGPGALARARRGR